MWDKISSLRSTTPARSLQPQGECGWGAVARRGRFMSNLTTEVSPQSMPYSERICG